MNLRCLVRGLVLIGVSFCSVKAAPQRIDQGVYNAIKTADDAVQATSDAIDFIIQKLEKNGQAIQQCAAKVQKFASNYRPPTSKDGKKALDEVLEQLEYFADVTATFPSIEKAKVLEYE